MPENSARRAARRTAAAAALVVATTLAGCIAAPASDGLYETARQANLLFKAAVATVQLHLYDGDWQVQEYGDLPVGCDGGYGFTMGRTTPEGWTLSADATTTGHRLARWLTDHGWKAQDAATQADGDVAVEASGRAVGVAGLVIEIRDGEASADAISVHAESSCHAGDPAELTAILYPGSPGDPGSHAALPAAEPAGAVPVFGFTEDGEPR